MNFLCTSVVYECFRLAPLCVVFLPALNLDVLFAEGAECFDEGFGQTDVGHQRDVVVDCPAADAVAVGQLAS